MLKPNSSRTRLILMKRRFTRTCGSAMRTKAMCWPSDKNASTTVAIAMARIP